MMVDTNALDAHTASSPALNIEAVCFTDPMVFIWSSHGVSIHKTNMDRIHCSFFQVDFSSFLFLVLWERLVYNILPDNQLLRLLDFKLTRTLRTKSRQRVDKLQFRHSPCCCGNFSYILVVHAGIAWMLRSSYFTGFGNANVKFDFSNFQGCLYT
jgi:hypothetical protein